MSVTTNLCGQSCVLTRSPPMTVHSGVKSNTATKPNWNNNALYTSVLENKLHVLPTFTFGEDRDRASVECNINSAIKFICTAIHDATNNSSVIPKLSFTPKPYCYPELNALCDSKTGSGGHFG